MKLLMTVVAMAILMIAGCNTRSDHPVFTPSTGASKWQIEAEINAIRELQESKVWGMGLDETGFGISREGARLWLGHVHATQKRVAQVSDRVEKSNGTSQQKTRWKQEMDFLGNSLKINELFLRGMAGD